jgi:hypothetical protein
MYCILTEVFLALTEVFSCFFLSCKVNARVNLAKTGHGPHSSKLVVICVVLLLFVLFYVLFACKCVLYYCHRVLTQLQVTNISYKIICLTPLCDFEPKNNLPGNKIPDFSVSVIHC